MLTRRQRLAIFVGARFDHAADRCELTPPCLDLRVVSDVIEGELRLVFDGPASGCIYVARSWEPGKIWVEHHIWAKCGRVVRAAIVCHAKAIWDGARCAPCADRLAGRIFRAVGVADDWEALEFFVATMKNRDGVATARRFHRGFTAG